MLGQHATLPLVRTIKSIQRGTISLSAVASAIGTVTAVNTSFSELFWLGSDVDSSAVDTNSSKGKLVLTNSTQITYSRQSTTGLTVVSYELVEYYPSPLALSGIPVARYIRSVQRGTITISNGASTGTATITAVTMLKARLRFLGNDADPTANGFQEGAVKIVLTNTTTITASRTNTTGTLIISFEITEFW